VLAHQRSLFSNQYSVVLCIELCAAAYYSSLVGVTPIGHAAEAGKVSVLGYLLDHGGDPAMPDAMGNTPLHDAADCGAFTPFQILFNPVICEM
jgi:ankyrin repeat protein